MYRTNVIYLYLFAFLFICGFSVCQQQPSKRITNQDVIDMVALGLPDDVIIEKIRTVTEVDFDTNIQGLKALKAGRVSDSVIRVMINPSLGNNTVTAPYEPAPAIRKEPIPARNNEAMSSPQEVGVYLIQNGSVTDVLPEIVNWQTGGVLKSSATLFIVKGDKNGKVLGNKSRIQASCPLEFLIKTLEGTSVEEYQLLRLHKKSNRREFRSVTGGILHVSGGAQRDEVSFHPEKIGSRTWKIEIHDLPNGEYGFLPPGVDSASISASGKMYTFEVATEISSPPSKIVSESRQSAGEAMPNNKTLASQPIAQETIGAFSDDNPTIRHDGITLSRVVAGGPADKAGIMVNDVVLAIGGHFVYTGQEMHDEIRRHSPGTVVSVRYRRHKTSYEASVVIGTAQ
jgi:hypothetical protein